MLVVSGLVLLAVIAVVVWAVRRREREGEHAVGKRLTENRRTLLGWIVAALAGVAAAVLILSYGETVPFEPPGTAPMNMRSVDQLGNGFVHKELTILRPPAQVSSKFRESLATVYVYYSRLLEALTSRQGAAIEKAAGAMRRLVEALPTDGLAVAATKAWLGHRTVLRTSLHQLQTARLLEDKQRHFSHIGEAMYCAIKSFGGIGSKVQVAFCAESLKGRGAYWLSSENPIINPYVAAKTDECVEIREQI